MSADFTDPSHLVIDRGDFEAVRRQPRFRRRPYRCLLLTRPDYPVYAELREALTGLGIISTAVPVAAHGDKAALFEAIVAAILQMRPDFLLTLSHLGVDAEGSLAALLDDLRLPLASWLLDSPDRLVAPFPQAAGERIVVFSCDADALPAIRQAGYAHVHALPLAAAPGRMIAMVPDAPGTGVAFLGEDYVRETGRRLRGRHFGRELLRHVAPLADRRIAAPGRGIDDLFAPDEAPLRHAWEALTPATRRQDYELAVLCRANTRKRAAVLRRLLPLAPRIVGPATWKRLLPEPGWT